ncbi:MAG: peptidyl-prolyl cis-trans isomerase [Polyangiaceae bacterium]|nr:peptidyl-prolyl cis-trans isomerase [Polyangiaceae bacterium]
MVGLILVGILGAIGVFTPAKEPGLAGDDHVAPAPSVAERAAPGASSRRARPPKRDREQSANNEKVGASHVLLAYKGATRAKDTVSRSKEEAKALADQVLARVRKGEDFSKVAQELSDCPSKARGGDLGTFARDRMAPAFSKAAFELKVGGVSEVVETPFGYHVIKRTQ